MLKRVSGVVLGAQEHQDVPFEQVVEMVQPPRRLNHTPIFQVVFSWQNQEWSLPQLPGVEIERLRMPYAAAKFDLQLDLAEEGGRIVGGLNYAVALFEEATIRRQVGYLMAMLEGMAADQKQEVAGIDVLEEEERKLLLEEWNATEAEYPEDKCIHELFEEQVRRTPGAIALVHEEQSLSYEELNRRANQFAHYLRDLGVKPDDTGRNLRGAWNEDGSGAAGSAEGRWRVCTAGPGIPCGEVEIRAPGQCAGGVTDGETSAGDAGWNGWDGAGDRS